MINHPFLTVGIPAYNNFETLIRAMDSVKDQTFKDLEILISDDCSKVDLKSSVEEWCSLNPEIKVRYFYQEKNLHITSNKRWILENAAGELLAFLEHDDFLIDNLFYEKVCELYKKNTKIKVFIGNAILDSPLGNELFFKSKIRTGKLVDEFQLIEPRKLTRKLNTVFSLEPLSINWSSVIIERLSALEIDAFGFSYLSEPGKSKIIRAFPHEENMVFLTLLHDIYPIAFKSTAVTHRKLSKTSFSVNFHEYTQNEEYPNDIAFFNYYRAANLDTTFFTKAHLYKRAVLTGLKILTPGIRNYLVHGVGGILLVYSAWIIGNFFNPLVHPLFGKLRRGHRIIRLARHERKYVVLRIRQKIRMIHFP